MPSYGVPLMLVFGRACHGWTGDNMFVASTQLLVLENPYTVVSYWSSFIPEG
jgi:hypothetical protein